MNEKQINSVQAGTAILILSFFYPYFVPVGTLFFTEKNLIFLCYFFRFIPFFGKLNYNILTFWHTASKIITDFKLDFLKHPGNTKLCFSGRMIFNILIRQRILAQDRPGPGIQSPGK